MRLFLTAIVLTALSAQTPGQLTIRPQISDTRGLADFDLDGNGGWRVAGSVLVLDKAGVPGGPIRRPAAIAVLKSDPVGDFTFTVEMRSTAPVDLAVRDVLLIFGYQSPTRFYYVHLAAKTDAVHNGIFVVDNADRRRLDPQTSTGRLTDQAWHRLRLERRVSTGSIAVYFDDDPAPVLSVTDTTILAGRVGVGSFDETGEYRSLELKGAPAKDAIAAPPPVASGPPDGTPEPSLLGEFLDDYGGSYSITASEWRHGRARYRITRWRSDQQYLIAQNDAGNPSEPASGLESTGSN